MKEFLTHPIFDIVSSIAKKKGVKAFVIGGFVRDILLNRPCKDIDIVVEGNGLEFAELVANSSKYITDVKYYKNFGTAMLRFQDYEIEFVGARKESYQRSSRKPIVENGTLEDDQWRRDFTINALAISLDGNYNLVDPFGGVKDLESKIIRTPLDPSITYSDDPLRMFRAIRFATQLGFEIEEKSFEAIKSNKDRVNILSMERIIEEINKILLAPIPSVGFKLLHQSELLDLLFPEITALLGAEIIDGKGHKDNFYHTLQVVDNIAPHTTNLWLRWAALLHDIAKPATKRFDKQAGWTFHGHEDRGAKMVPHLFKKWKLPLNEKMKYVQSLVRHHLRPIALCKDEVSDAGIRRLIVEIGEDLNDLLTLCRADITSKNDVKVKRYLRNFIILEEKIKETTEKDQLRNWQPPITGEMIMETFQLKPCKEVGILKLAVREAILENHIPNEYQAAYCFLVEEAAKINLYPINPISTI